MYNYPLGDMAEQAGTTIRQQQGIQKKRELYTENTGFIYPFFGFWNPQNNGAPQASSHWPKEAWPRARWVCRETGASGTTRKQGTESRYSVPYIPPTNSSQGLRLILLGTLVLPIRVRRRWAGQPLALLFGKETGKIFFHWLRDVGHRRSFFRLITCRHRDQKKGRPVDLRGRRRRGWLLDQLLEKLPDALQGDARRGLGCFG